MYYRRNRKPKIGPLFLLLLVFGLIQTVPGIPRINEVMPNPPGSDTDYGGLEFVEIYNPGPDTVRMLEFTLHDLSDTNDHLMVITFPSDSSSDDGIHDKLAPGLYAVILDPDYPLADNPLRIPSPVLLLTIAEDRTLGNGLKNDQDCVFLRHLSSGTNADSFCWSSDPGDGISWERIMPVDWTDQARWGYSQSTGGSTPGRINSLVDTLAQEKEGIRFESRILSYSHAKPLKLVWRNIPHTGILRIGIYDIHGFSYGWLEEGIRVTDLYSLEWNGRLPGYDRLKSGTYLIHLEFKPETGGRLMVYDFPFGVTP